MMHGQREFLIASVDRKTLVKKLVKHSWTMCTGFECEGFYWLNDSTSADGIQEYAVFKNNVQIESITVGWCDMEKLTKYVNELHDASSHSAYSGAMPAVKKLGEGHECGHCR